MYRKLFLYRVAPPPKCLHGGRLSRQTKLLSALICWMLLSGCGPEAVEGETGETGEVSEATSDASRAREQVLAAMTTQSTSGGDSDGDGIVDAVDQCPTPVIADHVSGELRLRANTENGCGLAGLPALCKGDSEPPRMILGNDTGLGYYRTEVVVKRQKMNGRTVFRVELVNADDADILETCSKLTADLVVALRVGETYYPWVCRGRLQPEQFRFPPANGHLNRQVRIDDSNPCVIDPAFFDVSQTDVEAALNNQQLAVAVGLTAVDGKGNSLRNYIGYAGFESDTCAVHIQQSSYTDTSASQAECTETDLCEAQISLNPVTTTLSKPTISPNPSVLAYPEFELKLQGTAGFNSDCGDLQIRGFLRNVSFDSDAYLNKQQRKLCSVTRPNGVSSGDFELTCLVDPESLYLPGQGVTDLTGEVEVVANTRGEMAQTRVPFAFTL